MSRGKLKLHRESWWIKDYPDALEYVKMILDSESHPDKNFDVSSGRSLLTGEYSILCKQNDETNKKRMAGAIVQLLDDPDYSCDAIPVAAELGLPEAKEWFLKLSEKPIEEMRKIKTNDFTNSFGCLFVYTEKHVDFLSYLKKLHSSTNNKLSFSERFSALCRIGEQEPEFILRDIEQFMTDSLSTKSSEQEKLTSLKFLTSGIFKKYGDGFCVDLAKRFKENLPREYQTLFYKALAQNPTPRFKPYLEELKKILEITD